MYNKHAKQISIWIRQNTTGKHNNCHYEFTQTAFSLSLYLCLLNCICTMVKNEMSHESIVCLCLSSLVWSNTEYTVDLYTFICMMYNQWPWWQLNNNKKKPNQTLTTKNYAFGTMFQLVFHSCIVLANKNDTLTHYTANWNNENIQPNGNGIQFNALENVAVPKYIGHKNAVY